MDAVDSASSAFHSRSAVAPQAPFAPSRSSSELAKTCTRLLPRPFFSRTLARNEAEDSVGNSIGIARRHCHQRPKNEVRYIGGSTLLLNRLALNSRRGNGHEYCDESRCFGKPPGCSGLPALVGSGDYFAMDIPHNTSWEIK